ncbi:protein trichome birefringence-like 2 [Senna tora]|uniref:Protein trichome birefringence-like 2 n=1 Tax=Senna tora TaxID=362788 RepID=A0A834X6K0_9FABA|nr:protein trichome birefringence-like 2 [Senna tora]
MDQTTHMYHDADIIVFNTGHWWTHEKTFRRVDLGGRVRAESQLGLMLVNAWHCCESNCYQQVNFRIPL